MKIGITGLAMIATLLCTVNVQAQSGDSVTTQEAQASILGGVAELPPQPGPPPNASPEFLVAEGEALLAAGYLDAAIQDFQKVVNIAPDTSPLVSRAWYGLARVYVAQGNVEFAKTSIEEVLSLNNDPLSVDGSRSLYMNLKGQAEGQLAQVQQQYLYLQYRYHSTSFLNFISKFFAWRDMEKAKDALESAQMTAGSFNPRYLIPPVGSGSASETRGSETYRLTPDELQNLLDRIPTSGTQADSADGATAGEEETQEVASAASGEETTESAGAEEPEVRASDAAGAGSDAVSAVAPADNLAAMRQSYMDAYQDLQTAMGSSNPSAIAEATKRFEEATRTYSAARRQMTAQ